jgi:hypothetical protein
MASQYHEVYLAVIISSPGTPAFFASSDDQDTINYEHGRQHYANYRHRPRMEAEANSYNYQESR